MSLFERIVLSEAAGGLGETLRARIKAVLSGKDHKAAHELGKWFADKFRIKKGLTPRGGKKLKDDANALHHFLSTSWHQTDAGGGLPAHLRAKMRGPAVTRDNWGEIALRWSILEPNLGKLVKMFTDEGGTVVPNELKVGRRIYRNPQGFTEKKLKGLIAKLEPVWKTVKGWRAKAFDGDLVVVLQGPKQFRGTSKGVYKSQLDELWVRAVPTVMKKMGTYGALDYILIHELGHRFDKRVKPTTDFDRQEWHTTKYSRTDSMAGSESFAELFALGIRDWPHTSWASSEDDGKAVVARFEKLMGG